MTFKGLQWPRIHFQKSSKIWILWGDLNFPPKSGTQWKVQILTLNKDGYLSTNKNDAVTLQSIKSFSRTYWEAQTNSFTGSVGMDASEIVGEG